MCVGNERYGRGSGAEVVADGKAHVATDLVKVRLRETDLSRECSEQGLRSTLLGPPERVVSEHLDQLPAATSCSTGACARCAADASSGPL